MPFGNKRRVRTGASTALALIAFAGILVFIGLFLERFPRRFDLTDVGSQSLSGETLDTLAALKEDVRAVAFPDQEGDGHSAMRNLLENYHVANQRFTYEIVDAERSPGLAKQYDVTTFGTTVLVSGTRTHMVKDPTEQALTTGLRDLMIDEVLKIYFTSGHGEHPLEGEGRGMYNALRRGVESSNFLIEPITLLTMPAIPDDAAAVVVGGPKRDFLLLESDLLRDYVRRGGGLIVMLDPGPGAGLAGLLEDFGVTLENDLIVDKLSGLFGRDYNTPVVVQYDPDSFLKGFRSPTFFPEARSVQPIKPPPPGITSVALASTSNEAWGEIGMEEIEKGEIRMDPERDIPGPVPVAVLSTVEINEEAGEAAAEEGEASSNAAGAEVSDNAGEGRVIVFGDSDFITDANFALSGNGDLFLNSLEYIARRGNPILIERRQREGAPVSLGEDQVLLLLFISFLGASLVLLAGVVVWRVRRKHR